MHGGLVSLVDVCRCYMLTVEEFLSWQYSIDRHGLAGLRTTRIQQRRFGDDNKIIIEMVKATEAGGLRTQVGRPYGQGGPNSGSNETERRQGLAVPWLPDHKLSP